MSSGNYVQLEEVLLGWGSEGNAIEIGPINFSAVKGEVVGIFGRSGTGKSTLLRALTGELEPVTGTIELKESCSVHYHDQDQKLVPWLSGFKNITIGQHILHHGTQTSNILDICGIDEFGHLKATELSGGQRARVAIARTLVEDGDIILLDEPFTGIDIRGQETLVEQLKRISGGKLIFISSHDPGLLVQLCSQIICFVSEKKDTKTVGKRKTSVRIFEISSRFVSLKPEERIAARGYKEEIKRLSEVLYD